MTRPRLAKLLTQPINRLLVASFLLVAAVPVAVLSGDTPADQVRRLLADGAVAFLAKPLDVRALLALVDRVREDGDSGRSAGGGGPAGSAGPGGGGSAGPGGPGGSGQIARVRPSQ